MFQAIILKQSLTSVNVASIDHAINELTDKILEAQKQSKKGIKAQKVSDIQYLNLTHRESTSQISRDMECIHL